MNVRDHEIQGDFLSEKIDGAMPLSDGTEASRLQRLRAASRLDEKKNPCLKVGPNLKL